MEIFEGWDNTDWSIIGTYNCVASLSMTGGYEYDVDNNYSIITQTITT